MTRYFNAGPVFMSRIVLVFSFSLYSADGNVESQRVVSKCASNQSVSSEDYTEKNKKSNRPLFP